MTTIVRVLRKLRGKRIPRDKTRHEIGGLHNAQYSMASFGTYVQSFAINLQRVISFDMAGMDQRNVGELQRKIELNFENSGSLANRADRASKHLTETAFCTTRFHTFTREIPIYKPVTKMIHQSILIE